MNTSTGLILVEGANLQGKSTLAQELALELGLPYLHEGKPEDGFRYYLKKALEWKGVVLDRAHLGECVYPLLKRDDRPVLESWQQHMIERYLLAKGAVLIHCTTDLEFRVEKFKIRGEEFVNLSELETEAELFDSAVSRSLLPVFEYDLQKTDKKKLFQKILAQLKTHEQKFLELEGCGQTRSELLDGILVGDEYGDHSSIGQGKGVFSQPWGSSRHLHQALELLLDRGRNLYITNSQKYPGDEERSLKVLDQELRLLTFWEKAQWPFSSIFGQEDSVPVVALGRKASERLTKLEVPHRRVNHPQFEFRFFYGELKRYAEDIEGALQP